MAKKPEGISALTPTLLVDNAQETIELYQKALGAEICGILNCPETDKAAHSCIIIGDSSLFISEAFPERGCNKTGTNEFYLYVDDAEAAFKKAKNAGFSELQQPEDTFWGDKVGILQDPNGNTWKIAERVREVSPEEMQEAMKQMIAAA